MGFTLDKVSVRLSNLMALDARAIGNWGCAPEHYPTLVQLALDGAIDVVRHTQIRPLTDLPEAFAAAHERPTGRRTVFAPGL